MPSARCAQPGSRVLVADGAGDTDLDIPSGQLADPRRGSSATRRGASQPTSSALADAVVRIPIYGRAESLNLATAAALCLYASARAQRQ